jgi:Predicted integral membrane protein
MKCDIIKDLMPGYIDGLLSEAGSDAVREHLEDCEACKHVYMQMKEEIILQGEGRQGENIFVEQAALDGLRKVNSRTKRLRTVALLGGLLAAMIVIGIFLKVYVIGSLLDAHIVRVTDFQYDEQTDNLMLSGVIDTSVERITRVKWKENPSINGRIDLFVYAAETLPYGQEKKEFSITIPNMKGKVVYVVGADYDQFKAYNWHNDHISLISELEEEICRRVDANWNQDNVLLNPVRGIRTIDGIEGIEFSVTLLTGEDAYYWRVNDTVVLHGDFEEAEYCIWISLEKPYQIHLLYYGGGDQEVP